LRWTTDHVADEEDAGILAYDRTTPDAAYALVVINTQGRHASATAFGAETMQVGAAPGSTLVDVLTDERITVAADGTLRMDVAPHGVRILVPEG
jgi:hypothetical protein